MHKTSILLGGIVLAVAATATTLSPARSAETGRERVLRVVLKNRDYRVVDLPPAGPSHGDVRVGNAELYNRSESRRIGSFHLFCVLTDPADRPRESDELTQCQYTFRLPAGDITADGLTRRASLGDAAAADLQAVTGGTRTYRDVRGHVRLLASREDERRIVLELR